MDTAHGNRTAWLILLRAPALGSAALRRLVAHHGSAARALGALRGGHAARGLEETTRGWLDSPDGARIDADLAWLAEPAHHLLGWDDPDYPTLLRDIPGAPAALFVAGDASLLWMPQVAIVGSRAASPGGLATTRRFARTLAAAGFTITSGMADGIDGAAHDAALEVGGRTVAVLGTGPDIAYPRKHAGLATRIEAAGALVSELPPGTPGKAEHFPRRNRILSGLALGTLVVEAGLKSGSLITARCATEQGREVFAIPGAITNPLARGCHQLIRDGARLVETPEEVGTALATHAVELGDHLRERLGALVPGAGTEGTPAGPDAGSDPDRARLIAALAHEACDLDTLAARSGLDVPALSSMLLVLELEGTVATAPGGRYQRVDGGT